MPFSHSYLSNFCQLLTFSVNLTEPLSSLREESFVCEIFNEKKVNFLKTNDCSPLTSGDTCFCEHL